MLTGKERAGAVHHDDVETTEDVGDEPDKAARGEHAALPRW